MLQPNSPAYDPDQYHMLRAEYEQATQYVQQIRQQATEAEAQARAQQQYAEQAKFEAVENEWRPKLFATVPELSDPTKAPALIGDLQRFAVEAGVPADQLAQATSQEVLLLWKAMQFDKQQAAAQRVKAQAKPQPKQASPALKPGVPVPQSAAQRGQIDKARQRLAATGRGEDAVALFEKLLG
jgi:hypothetical protein